MIPIRFGTGRREMVGFYHPPELPVASAPGVLICNAFGAEAIRSQRMLRLLADRLARAGCPVLRFDYFGAGDSAGDDDAASVLGWAGDIGTAHRELIARSGKVSAAWLGVRLGGSLCSVAAQSLRTPLSSLVLWDPIVDGSEYLAALSGISQSSSNYPKNGFDISRTVEVMAYPLSEAFKAELKALNISLPAGATATIVISNETPALQRWQQKLSQTGANFDWRVTNADAGWTSDKAMNTGAIPAEVLRSIETQLLVQK